MDQGGKTSSDQLLQVLLVEKDEEIISSIHRMFSEIKECQLGISSSLEGALLSITAMQPDLVLLSHSLIGNDYVEMLPELYRKYPSIYVIVYLPSTEETLVGEYIKTGINGFAFTDRNFKAALTVAVKQALISIVERKSFLLASLSASSFFVSDDDSDDLLHLSTFQPGQFVLQYRILEEIAEGGMGQIYRAEDQILRRQVALKVLPVRVTKNEKARKRLLREARLAASLNHPNVCSIYEIKEHDGHTFISMEYVEGITLHKRLQSGTMELDEILDAAIQIADALKEAHKKNIIHRDIKSLNILLTDRKQVKILDFGLAKKMPDSETVRTSSQITETGEVLGTLHFMSPEQALAKPVDHRSDIFSFGVVLYQMLTGQVPFDGKSLSQVVDSIVNNDPTPVSRLNPNAPGSLIRMIHKMLNKDPGRRFQNMDEVWTELQNIRQTIGKNHSELDGVE